MLPTGTVTFLFTDIEGSTRLLQRLADEYPHLLDQHRQLLRTAWGEHRGVEVSTEGDSSFVVFEQAGAAVAAARVAQRALTRHSWPSGGEIRVRMGLHTGEAVFTGGDYVGMAVHLAARVSAAGHGGQVLLSDTTRALAVDESAKDLGEHRLKDIDQPVRIFQLLDNELPSIFPPLRSLTESLPETAATSAPAVVAFRPTQPLLCPVLIGRERHRGSLLTRLDEARRGRGGVVALVGDAGAGKTRLCTEAADAAREMGMVRLSGRAVPGDTPSPFRPLTEAFVAAFRSGSPTDAPEFSGFEGHIRRLIPSWETSGSAGADESPVLLGEAAVRLLHHLAGTSGALLILEDLHWADRETMTVVEYLIDALRDEAVLVVFTTRPTGATVDLLPRLQRRNPDSLIAVEALGSADVEKVVHACLATDHVPGDLVTFAASLSDGNPFLIEELLAGLVSSGALALIDGGWVTTSELTPTVPFSLGDSIRQRLSLLAGPARRVVAAAAVLGRRFDWELLPSVSELDGGAVIEALREGVNEQLIETDGSGFKFRHALTREAVLESLLPPERHNFSARAWAAIERAHPGLPGAWCELAAELALASGDEHAAAVRLVESARRAASSGALSSAEATARHALRLAGDRPDTRDEAEQVLVGVLALAGQPEEATAIGTALAERLAHEAAAVNRRAELFVTLARAAVAGGRTDAVATLAGQARELLTDPELDAALAARVEAVAAHVELDRVNLGEAAALAESAIARAVATGQPAVECEALEVCGRIARAHDIDESIAYFSRAATIAQRHGLTGWELRSRQELALFSWTRGRVEPLLEVRDLAARSGALVTVAFMDLAMADFSLGAFDTQRCRDSAQACVDASRRYGLAMESVGELWLAGSYALSGDTTAMEQAASRALARDPSDPRILGDLWGRVRATDAIVRNDRAHLRRCLDKQMDYARVAPVSTSIFPNRILWTLVQTIESDDGGEAARAELAASSNLRLWPQFDAMFELFAGLVAARSGDTATASALVAAASRELRTSALAQGTVEFHHLLVCEVAARDGWGDPAGWVRPSEVFFDTHGFGALAKACRAVLAAAGAPIPRKRRGSSTVPPGLRALGITSREYDVLEQLLEGRTNREIGERLFLSPRTVERHVTSLFDRTGIRSRDELAEFARTQTG